MKRLVKIALVPVILAWAAAGAPAAVTDPEAKYPANTAPVKVDNAFSKANPDYKQGTGAAYEEKYLDVAVAQLDEAAGLDADQKTVARQILRAYIYDWLDALVRADGKLSIDDLNRIQTVMDNRFKAELPKAKYEQYILLRRGVARVGDRRLDRLLWFMTTWVEPVPEGDAAATKAAGILKAAPARTPDVLDQAAALFQAGMTCAQVKAALPPSGTETVRPGYKVWVVAYPVGVKCEVVVVGRCLLERHGDGDPILMRPLIRNLDAKDRGWGALAADLPAGTTLEIMRMVLPPTAEPDFKRNFEAGAQFTITYSLDADFEVRAKGDMHGVQSNDDLWISAPPEVRPRAAAAAK